MYIQFYTNLFFSFVKFLSCTFYSEDHLALVIDKEHKFVWEFILNFWNIICFIKRNEKEMLMCMRYSINLYSSVLYGVEINTCTLSLYFFSWQIVSQKPHLSDKCLLHILVIFIQFWVQYQVRS